MGLAAFLAVCGASYAEGSFGLEEVLERAKTSNPQVRIQKISTEEMRKEKDRAWKNYVLPPVSFSDSDEWDVVKKYGLGVKSLSIGMNVFEGGKTLYGYKSLKSSVAMSENQETLSEIKAQEEAVTAYFAVLNAQKQLEITNRSIELLEKQKNRVWDLYSNGKLVPKSEYLKIEADLEAGRLANIQNIENIENTMGVLNKVLGFPLENNLIIEDFNPELFLASKGDLKQKNEKPIENTILGENAQHSLDMAEYGVKLAKADLYPSINIGYSHNFWERDDEKGWSRSEGDAFTLGFSWTFEWGGTLDSIESAKQRLEQAKINYEDTMKGLTLSMKNQYNRVKSLYDQSLLMKKRMDLLKENMDIDSMRYENELLSTFDYLNSVNSYKNAQASYYAIQRDLVLAVIQYENLYR